jgi:MFS family permease
VTVSDKAGFHTESSIRAARSVTGPLLASEGLLGEVFVTLTGGAFLTATARMLGCGPFELSLLVGIPFLAQLGQLLGPVLERRLGSRRRFVVPALAWGRSLWLVPVLLLLLGARGERAVDLALFAVALLATTAMVGANGWLSWMSEAIPGERRTRLFGIRSAAVAVGTLTAGQGGALFLDAMKARNLEAVGLAMLGAVAVICGVGSARLLLRVPDVPPRPAPEESSWASVLRLLRTRGLQRVLGFFVPWNLAIGLPSPFWTLFMLERLHMSFTLIALYNSVVLLIRLLVNNPWSRVIERVGPRRVLIACSAGISLIPLIWFLARPDFLLPIALECVVSGVCWAGFNQAAFLAPLGSVTAADRSRGLAIFSVVTGAAFFLSSTLGGAILSQFGTGDFAGYHLLFGLSFALRAMTGFLALRLGEPGISAPVFFVNFVGYGVLRRPSWGRQIFAPVPGAEQPPDPDPRTRPEPGKAVAR